jgi:hypothetical protein
MNICFTLTMPNRSSWNGKWSGEKNLYAVVRRFSNSKAGTEKAKKILSGGSYYHAWSDGWGACVSAREVDSKESTKIKRQSKGFYGYDWMIDNIISHGSCYNK